SRFIFADHLVEFDDHRLDIILHPGGTASDRLVLRMRYVVFAEADVVKQSQRQVPRLHYSSVHAIFFLAGFEFRQFTIKSFSIVESQAFFHCLSSVLRTKRVLFENARHPTRNSFIRSRMRADPRRTHDEGTHVKTRVNGLQRKSVMENAPNKRSDIDT